ncbi:MAG: STAS domain-containing protein [Bdellovibrionales bacterium]|jgi:anti-anti-sigma factor|nr:STAS domain-containing protein [Bdellovibrionales bacterium]
MQASFITHQVPSGEVTKEVTVVYLSGRIDADSVDRFRQACAEGLRDRSVLFHLGELSFVGSTGLRGFLEALYSLAKSEAGDIRFCQVSVDFRYVLEATPLRMRPVFESAISETEALRSFQTSLPGPGAPMFSGIEEVEDELIEDELVGVSYGDENLSFEG